MKSISRRCSSLLAVPLLLLPACGDDSSGDGGAACGEVAACGGDPTGAWSIADMCLDASLFRDLTEGCNAEIDIDGVDFSGSAEFRSDGTYVVTSAVRGPMRVVYPPACLTQDGVTFTCAQLDEGLKSIAGTEGSPLASVTCAAAGASCACDLVYNGTSATEDGTWSVSGTTLTTTSDDGVPEEVPFCIDGSSLTLGVEAEEGAVSVDPMKYYMRLTKR
ncbi:hypothetical protein [Sorangium sp. So ce1335]|uniref:hypothetical protein n=1 Tax=Sorangium sp. So ce1335 TaxID=3133335 RepID=UPI003F628C83